MHCSSAGEFEQGKPLAEALKHVYPQYKLLLTFFSPSGYTAAIKYDVADVISYLPIDTAKNARRFVGLVKPRLAIFVKYEFWYHHLSTAFQQKTPLLLVSAVFRKEQVFFKKYGGFFRNMLRFFQHIFVQDILSVRLLEEAGIVGHSLGGDTRFDRVDEISLKSDPVPFIREFVQNKTSIVAGSTWGDDENLLKEFIATNADIKLILAPHELSHDHLVRLQNLFPNALMYSAIKEKNETVKSGRVLIVDAVGLLSRLYQHAAITYVGGGFTKDGIHNVLEAAVWGKAVLFGPNYKKYREAGELIKTGGGFSVADAKELENRVRRLLSDTKVLQTAGEKASAYIKANTGATEKIIRFIQEKRLLTKP